MPALRHAGMLEVNEFLVLDFVREHGRTTRPEIGRALDLSPSSVSRIAGRLIAAGLITESPGAPPARGRPRACISFNEQAGAVIGIDLGGTRCHAALADLSGSILHEDVRPTHGASEPYPTLLEVIGDLRAHAAALGVPVRAVAVGVPAILDADSGMAVSGPAVAWEQFPVVPMLAADVDLPVLVENDVNLAALAHAWRGDGRHVDDFVTVSIGTGVGAAVVANGRLVKGRRNGAGEIGYLTLSPGLLAHDLEQNRGELEWRACGPGIVHQARTLLAASDEPSSLRDAEVTPAAVFAAAAAGDRLAGNVIEDTLDYVALALVAIAALLDPALVVIDGAIGRSLQPYLDDLERRIRPRLWATPRIAISSLGPDATMLGAIAAALQQVRRDAAPASVFGLFDVGTNASASVGARHGAAIAAAGAGKE